MKRRRLMTMSRRKALPGTDTRKRYRRIQQQHLYGHLFGHFSARLIPWVFICIWFPLVGVSYYAFDYAIHCVSCASSQAEKPPAHR